MSTLFCTALRRHDRGLTHELGHADALLGSGILERLELVGAYA